MTYSDEFKCYCEYIKYQKWLIYARTYGLCETDCYLYKKWQCYYLRNDYDIDELCKDYESWVRNIPEIIKFNEWIEVMKECICSKKYECKC